MSEYELPKAYDFISTESRIYEMWEKNDYFRPLNDPSDPNFDPEHPSFVISIPPPNVTGELHLGHAMFVSMEDLMIRYHRMKGFSTLWVPGTDHAGIATQLQVEKSLTKEGLTREEIGRDEFLQRTWAWKEKYGGIITQQIRRLGASCDWDRERFTLDEGLSKAVREAFVRLYEKGLIYRGPRLINWSPGLKTAVSDLEVEYTEEPGKLYYFKYMLDGSDGEFIPVATTRPETILGDTGLAIHPQDERYRKYVGYSVIVPILGRKIPVIADDYVDREFGTGALKITPGHDPNDYEIGERHGLEVISILDSSAQVNENGGPYQGLDRFKCREVLWEDMRKAGLVIKEESYMMSIPRSQRGGEIIEPMISTQWFVSIQPLADAAIEAVRTRQIKIIPDRFTKIFFNWMENIQDWCISRQLWWGHRIPVWHCQVCSKMTVMREDPKECVHCGSPDIEQDPDVLDTWFSSALWPFSTLGWPDITPDYQYFYPTTMMETGYDILFFWVARMIMTGLEFTGNPPFETIYLHGLIRDEHGRKMSKSYGNVIDPLTVMDQFGTDALRFTLLVGSTPGNDMNLSIKKVEGNRNFANKIWNAGRYVISMLDQIPDHAQDSPQWTLADSWIWARLQELTRDVERLIQNYQYGEAGRQIYEFFWGEFADWYIEISKLQVVEGGDRAYYTAQNLVRILDLCLRMLHPYTPFITEELWGHLRKAVSKSGLADIITKWPDALIIAPWPDVREIEGWEADKVADFTLIQDTIRAIRNIRSEKNVPPGKDISAIISAGDKIELFRQQIDTLSSLAHLDSEGIDIVYDLQDKPENHIALVVGSVEVYLPVSGMVDIDVERSRLAADLKEVEIHIERLQNLLAGAFSERAPKPVVEKEREKLRLYMETRIKLMDQLSSLEQPFN
jgi:valyl-tRNA synthetase